MSFIHAMVHIYFHSVKDEMFYTTWLCHASSTSPSACKSYNITRLEYSQALTVLLFTY